MLGKVLGRYQVQRQGKSGPFFQIYHGVQVGLDRSVRILVLPPSLAQDRNHQIRFRALSQIPAQVAHSRCVTIYDSGQAEGVFYTVTESLSEEDLRERLEAKTLEAPEALRIAVEILEGLTACHARGVVHGNLLPESIRFDQQDHAILTQFRLPQDQPQASPAGAFFLAPERLQGAPASLATDLYQYGALLHLLTGGDIPEPGTKVSPASHRDPEYPPELDTLIQELLAPDPAQRPPRTAEVMRNMARWKRKVELQRVSRQAPASSSPTAPRPPPVVLASEPAHWTQHPELVSFVETVTGGPGDLRQRETQLRLAVILGPFLVLTGVGCAYLFGILGTRPLILLEQIPKVGTRSAQWTFRTNQPCYTQIEYYTDPKNRSRTRFSASPSQEETQKVESLRPESKYFYRFVLSLDPKGASPTYSQVFDLRTRAEIEISGIQVLNRRTDRVTIRWTTNLPASTQVRVGESQDYHRVVEDPEKDRAQEHSLVVDGLEPDTEYHFQVVAKAPGDTQEMARSRDRSFRTRAREGAPKSPRKEALEEIGSRIQSLTPNQRERLADKVETLFGTPGDLDPSAKEELLENPTTPKNFGSRIGALRAWAQELEARGVDMPRDEADRGWKQTLEYLKTLEGINPSRAQGHLDEWFQLLAELDPALSR